MGLSTINLLSAIVFSNALASGLTVPLLTPHIKANGGSHIITGSMVAGTFAFQRISRNFHAHFQNGVKFSMSVSLIISLATFLFMVISSSYWIVLLCRFLYALANRINIASKEFITEVGPPERLASNLDLLEIARVLGVSIGAIAGGYIFYFYSSFALLSLIAAILCLTNLLLLDRIEDTPVIDTSKIKENLLMVPAQCQEEVRKMRELKWRDNWDTLLLKIAYVTSFTIFSTKFALLLTFNYDIGHVLIGYTVAYQSMLVFATQAALTVFSGRARRIMDEYADWVLLTCSMTLVAIFYAPSYECYLIIFVPLILLQTATEMFVDETLGLRANPVFYDTLESISAGIEILVPLFFGCLSEVSGKHAFKIFALLPSAVCIYILNKRFIGAQGPRPRPQAEHKED